MPTASFVQDSFRGGEWSKAAQGRISLPSYRTALNVCLNSLPIESEAWVRRSGTRHCAVMRGGANGRVIPFDFNQPFPYEMLFTDGVIRFLSETNLVTTNDDATMTGFSGADPVIINTDAAHGWSTGDQVLVVSNVTQLMNRQLEITVLSPTSFFVVDAISGAGINVADLDAFVSGTVRRIAEIVSPYTDGAWRNVRSIQAETTAVLLNGTLPQILTVEQAPSEGVYAEFALAPADFIDGPYLDPIPGSFITASALSGLVTLTLSFQPYDPAIAYSIGDRKSVV